MLIITMRRIATIASGARVAVLLLAALPLCALAARGLSPDQAVLAARDAFRAGDRVKLEKIAPLAQGHVLEPYVEYWRLRLRLEDALPEDVKAFLDRNADSLLAERLRSDWLKLLGRNERWEIFREQLPLLANDDAEVACFALLARWRSQDPSAAAEIRQHWYAPRELPDGCASVAEAMLQSGEISSAQVWERFRLLTGANLLTAAKRLMTRLPRAEAIDSRAFDSVAHAPVRYLESLRGSLRSRAARELGIFAVTRLARSEPQIAESYWDRNLRDKFSLEDQGYVWGQLATSGAMRLVPDAVEWFARAGDAPLSDEQLAWRARIALRAGLWAEVKAAIERMSPLGRWDPAWTYWMGRALAATGNPADARTMYGRIAAEHHFYGRLAAEELGMPLQLPPKAAPPAPEEIAAASAVPGLQRSLALYRLDMRVEATREWNWCLRGMDDRQLLAAAELARSGEVWDRAINTADRTVWLHDFSVRYLAPYREVLAGRARERELEENWVLGLVRQESRFIANAKSVAGASGLMQLMPSTARWVARKLGMKDYSQQHVTDVNINAALGTFYLRHVLDDLNGNTVLAAAAYNAGPGRARKWRGSGPLEGAIYAESIPFNETRDYVKKVMVNTLYYAALRGGPVRPLKERLGVIAPRSAADRIVSREEGAP